MRNFKLAMSVLAMGMFASSTFAATQGKVIFDGELINETCQIVNGEEDVHVALPKMSIASLATAGAEAGSKAFEIKVDRCANGLTQVAAFFEAIGSTGMDSQTGNLVNTATQTPAENVQIRLYNGDEQPLLLGNAGQFYPIDATAKTATLRYFGGYYATAATKAGKVHAEAKYTLSYP